MKILRIVPMIVIAVGCSSLAGCSEEAQEKTAAAAAEVKDSWDSIKQYTIERSADFRLYLDGQLSEIDRKMEGLSARTGESWDATRAELAVKRDALAAQIGRLGDATADTWQDARDKSIELYEDLRDSVQRAVSQP